MKLSWLLFLLVVLVGPLDGEPISAVSIVPKEAAISDYQAYKAYAKALSHHRQTLPEAIELLRLLSEYNPSDFSVSWEYTLALMHISDDEHVSLVPKKGQIDEDTARLTLARILAFHRKGYPEALAQYAILLAKDPNNIEVLSDLGNIYNNEKQYEHALGVLQQLRSLIQGGIEFNDKQILRLAQFEAELGYAVSSRNLFATIVTRNEDFMLEYAHMLLSWGDFYRAEAIYREALQQHPGNLKLQLKLIDTLIGEQRFEEAEGACLVKVASLNGNERKPFLETLVAIKLLRKNYPQALEWNGELIALAPDKEQYTVERAQLLFKLEQFDEALALFQQLHTSSEWHAEAHLGSGKCLLKLGDDRAAKVDLEVAASDSRTKVEALYYLADEALLSPLFLEQVIHNTATAQELKLWAECYGEEGFNPMRKQLYLAASRLDKAYFPGILGLAESLEAELAFDATLAVYDMLLTMFPNNSKLLLGQARTTSYNKQYLLSLDLYDALIALNVSNPVPQLEQARVAYWGKMFKKAVAYYEKLLESTHSVEWGKSLIHKKVSLELQIIKLRWNMRPWHCLPLYNAELSFDPASDFWNFEYAQDFCSLGECEEAKLWYEKILHFDPLNTLAGMALDRERMQSIPSISVATTYWQEQGYGELDQVSRYEVYGALKLPLSCQESIRLLQRRWIEHTYFDNGYHIADGATVEWNRTFNWFMTSAAALTYKHYRHDFGVTYTGLANLSLNLWDYGQLRIGYNRLDEVCNYFNLKQKTQKGITWLSINSYLDHAMEATFLAEYIRYNDNNRAAHAVLGFNYAFTNHPRTLKLGLSGEFRTTQHRNIFIYSPTGQLLDIIYPYWTPQHYFLGQVCFEWRHDYGWLEFCAAPEQFYDIKFAFGDDTLHNPYWFIKAEWQHQFYSNSQIGLTAYIQRSHQWNGKGIWFYCTYQF